MRMRNLKILFRHSVSVCHQKIKIFKKEITSGHVFILSKLLTHLLVELRV